jgi:CDP-4-dehydro-6-deoxyglucose reductase, E3
MSWRVRVLETGAEFDTAGDEPLLEAAARHGITLPHECTFGGCGTCRCRVAQGRVEYEGDELPLALSPQEAQAGYALACQARARSDLVISVPQRGVAPPPERRDAVVRSVRNWVDGIAHLELELEGDAPTYLPGQYMNVLLDDGSHRSFSMASAPAGTRVDFHLRRIPGGQFTDEGLRSLVPGRRLQVDIPLGTFRFHAEDDRPLVMVATGTGIAPIKSMLEALLDDDDCPPVSLYWGMRTDRELYLVNEILGWADRLYDFQFVPVLSRPDANWRGRRGYVQSAVVEDCPDLSGHAVYLCGSPSMIADAKRQFVARGASLDHLYADAFSFHHEAVLS